jgi:hypothetical protein
MHQTVDRIIKILLKYVDRQTAHRIARDLYCHVRGDKLVVDTFRIIAEQLEYEEEEEL